MARERTGIMLAYQYTEKRFNQWPKPIIAQPKLEGDRLRALNSGLVLFSSSAMPRVSIPHIKKEMMQYPHLFKHVETDGEAYKHGWRHSDIRSVVSRTKNLHEKHEEMEYWIFDIVSEDVQWERLQYLEGLFSEREFKYLKLVPYYFIETLEEMQKYYDLFLDQGFEGIILRHHDGEYQRRQSTFMMKLKPRMSGWFTIVGFEEEVDKFGMLKGTLGSIRLQDEKGKVFSVGTGPTKEMRDLLWKNQEVMLEQPCKIRFQGYTKVREVPKMQSVDKEWLQTIKKVLSS